jgi:hypothetical protein
MVGWDRTAMGTETSEVIGRISERIDALEVSLRAEIRDSLSESKRHANVLNEDVRDDIRMLAESFAAMSVKLDSLQR